MKKLDRLIKEAKRVCKFRGHDMPRFGHLHSTSATADCRKCGAWVMVTTRPRPNEVEISGSAVAVDCKDGQ